MAGLDDLKAAEAKMGESVTSAIAKIAADTQALVDAHNQGSDDSELESLAQQVNDRAQKLNDAVSGGSGAPASTGQTNG